jgi:class 3 adenylate cyclase
MDVAAWLQDLGLERYVSAFRDNDMDAEVLLKLTAEDLISIGVTSVGHRRKLLDAITSLGMAVPAAVVAAPTPGGRAQVDAERWQLTVMFCDVVGSTALSTRHDPEDLRELIGDYHRAVAATVGCFDGFVAKHMGDGVLVYFGYPQAHEDDAEQAVRAALAVIEAVSRLPAREDLRVRLGIATGLAVVGDLIGEGAAQERGVVGETPNLAARLQALATPNTVVIAEATRRQIGQLFDLEDLGPQQLAGFAQLQRAWRVLGESGEVSRFEALRSGETPARRVRRGNRVTAATLGAGKKWRRTGGADFRRARHRQVATDGGTFRAHRKRAAHPAALFLLAAPPRQRALSLHRQLERAAGFRE